MTSALRVQTLYLQRLLPIAIVVFMNLTALAGEELRSWKRESDGNTIAATLIDYDEPSGIVRLKLKSGTEAKIEAKQANVEKLRAAAKEPRLESVNPEGGGGHMIHIYKPAG